MMREHPITLDDADLDVLYVLVAGPHSDAVAARLGHSAQHRTFSCLHRQLPQPMPAPAELRRKLEEGDPAHPRAGR